MNEPKPRYEALCMDIERDPFISEGKRLIQTLVRRVGDESVAARFTTRGCKHDVNFIVQSMLIVLANLDATPGPTTSMRTVPMNEDPT